MTTLQIIEMLESMLREALDIIHKQEELLLLHGIETDSSDIEEKRARFYIKMEESL